MNWNSGLVQLHRQFRVLLELGGAYTGFWVAEIINFEPQRQFTAVNVASAPGPGIHKHADACQICDTSQVF